MDNSETSTRVDCKNTPDVKIPPNCFLTIENTNTKTIIMYFSFLNRTLDTFLSILRHIDGQYGSARFELKQHRLFSCTFVLMKICLELPLDLSCSFSRDNLIHV